MAKKKRFKGLKEKRLSKRYDKRAKKEQKLYQKPLDEQLSEPLSELPDYDFVQEPESDLEELVETKKPKEIILSPADFDSLEARREVNSYIRSVPSDTKIKLQVGQDDFVELSKQSELMMYRIQNMIDKYPYRSAEYLNNILKSDINRYGRDAVMDALEAIPSSEIDRVDTILYYPGNRSRSDTHNDLRTFAEILKGYIPDEAESKEIADIMDADAGWDDDIPF